MSTGQLLYRHTRPRRITTLKTFALTQGFVWSYMGYVTYDTYNRKKKVKKTELPEDAGIMQKVVTVVGESSITKGAAYFSVGAGLLLTIAAAFWCRQSIKSVYLLNRNRVCVNTYGFPREKSFTIPVAGVQSINPRANVSYLRLSLNDELLPYIIDRDGDFPSPKLFNAVTAPSYAP